MSQALRMHFLQDVFQMITFALVSVINQFHINELHLFWDTLYSISFFFVKSLFKSFCFLHSVLLNINNFLFQTPHIFS